MPASHPLRAIRKMAKAALDKLGRMLTAMYAAEVKGLRRSIAPKKLLCAMLLLLLFCVRSERQLIEQVQYNLLFQWFIGLAMDDAAWVSTKEPPTQLTRSTDSGTSPERLLRALAALRAALKGDSSWPEV